MREREGGPGAGGVSPHGVEQRGGGALLQAFREKVAGQRLLGHESVQVGMRERERTVGTGKGGQRLGPVASGGFEGGSGLLESDGDDGGFQGGLARQVLVEGGRAVPSRAPSRRIVSASAPSSSSSSSARRLRAWFICSNAGRVWRSSDLLMKGTRSPRNCSCWT